MNGKKAVFSAMALTGLMVAAPAFADLESDEPGSVLVYPVFESQGDVSTQIRLTNVFPTDQWVKFVTVCGYDKREVAPFAERYLCEATDKTYKLTPYETLVIDVERLNPQCTEGFVVAYEVDSINDGNPVGNNALIGSYLIDRMNPNRGGADQAIPIQYVGTTEAEPCDGTLCFDGQNYEYLPDTLWTDFRAVSFEPTKATDLVVLTMDTWAGRNNFATFVSIDAWNENEDNYSAANEFFCWNRIRLDDMNRGFRMNNPGGQDGYEYGAVRVTAEDSETARAETILGAIIERSNGYYTVRNMFHTGDLDTIFVKN